MTRTKAQQSIVILLRDLDLRQLKEAADFILFLKSRSLIDPEQTYFWTKKWQDKELRVERDKNRNRIIGDGSPESLLRILKT